MTTTVEPPKTPRYAPNAERGVIGACLLGRAYAAKARLALSAEDFYDQPNRLAFMAICDLLDSGMEVDLVTTAERLRLIGKLGEAGGVEYLDGCGRIISTAENIGEHARIILWYALKRKIDAQLVVTQHDQSPENVATLGNLILKQQGLSVSGFLDFREGLGETWDKYLEDNDKGIDVGIKTVDNLLGGLFKGDILTVGARTGCGKTAIKTKMMLNIARMGHECLYITTEMTKAEMLCRVLPIAAGIPAWKLNRKALTYDDFKRVNESMATDLSKLPIKIWAHPSPSISDIQSAIVQSGCRVAFLDYLQRFTFPELRRNDMRTYQIADFMKRLKTFAGEVGCSIVMGCQLNRRRDKEKEPPTLSDLSDSGAVENESAKVGLIWENPEGPFNQQGNVPLEWIQAKNRKGRTGPGGHLALRPDFIDMITREFETPNAPKPIDVEFAVDSMDAPDPDWFRDKERPT